MDVTVHVFNGRKIEVINFDDVTSGEHVIEFRDPRVSRHDALIAVIIPNGGDWHSAQVSLNPKISGISAELLEWAISVAHGTTGSVS